MLNNKLFNQLLKERNGHYIHALEVNNVYELESIIEGVIDAYSEFKESDYIEFFNSMELYYLGDNEEEEQEVFNFSFNDAIKEALNNV